MQQKTSTEHDFMTIREVAELLRLKERKIYDLVAHKQIPCTRVSGKWLFPRRQIESWLARNSEYQFEAVSRQPIPPVVVGSHDPLLEWALGALGFPLSLQINGSTEGLKRFVAGNAVICGIHLLDGGSGEYNVPMVKELAGLEDIVLIEWARREQGLLMAPGNPLGIRGLTDLQRTKAKIIERQEGAGSRILLAHLLAKAGLSREDLVILPEAARSHTDVGFAICSGQADVGLAVYAIAKQLRLEFLPLCTERFDLVIRRRDYFEPTFQQLLQFARSEPFRDKAAEMGGYDLSGFGTVHYNGP
jgi:putative molybdopterin biosynthesis protein